MKWIRRKLFELGLKLVLRYQQISIVTGPTLWLYYKNSPAAFKAWKGYRITMAHGVDAYWIIRDNPHPRFKPGKKKAKKR